MNRTWYRLVSFIGLLALISGMVGGWAPPAVLAAIIFPEVLRPGGEWDLSPGNARLLAGLAAALTAWLSRSVLLTIIAGMGTLWALQALLR